MAEKENIELLKKEASCPVCLDFFSDPVMTDCGHNFCKQCIDTCWVGSERNVTCPECRAVLLGQHTLRVNRKLANMVEVARRLNDSREKCDKDTMCCTHQQPLQLFCENDAKFLCVVCGLSKEHKRHKVLPVEEAVEEYKGKLEHSLTSLRKQIKMNRKSKIEEERKIQELQKNVACVRQRIITEFEQLHNFLNEQQHFFLAKLEHEEKRIKDILNENLKKLSEMNYEINRLTLEIEDKLRSQDKELLMAIGDTFERCDMDFHINNMAEGLCIKECSFPLQYTVWKRMLKTINPAPASLTLDSNTAHTALVLSDDMKSVKLGNTRQELSDHPDRFTNCYAVVSHEGFTSGRHYWEIEVGKSDGWNVGIIRESVTRKGKKKGMSSLKVDNGFWTVCRCSSLCDYFDNLVDNSISRLGIYLDYERGQLLFCNAENMSVIYNYSCTFTEKVFPFIYTEHDSPVCIVTSIILK